MSEFEANLPGLDLNEENGAAKKAAKKAARKTATKKAARKTAKAATAAEGETAEKPAAKKAARKTAKTAAAKKADESSAGAPAPAAEKPAARAPRAQETDSRRSDAAEEGKRPGAARETGSRQSNTSGERGAYAPRAQRAGRGEDDVPMSFSASPDDMDEYGDVRERNRRETADTDKKRDVAEDSDSRPADRKGDAAEGGNGFRQRGENGNQRRQGEYRDYRYGKGERNERSGSGERGERPANGERSGNGERGANGERSANSERGSNAERGERLANGERGNAQSERNGGERGERQSGYGQPFNKKGHFQKNNGGGQQGNGGQGNSQQGGGQQGNHPQGGKFQKFNKKGDKFNPNAQQGQGDKFGVGQQGNKKLKPGKVKPGKKGSWQSQFAAASEEDTQPPVFDGLLDWDLFRSPQKLEALIAAITTFTATQTGGTAAAAQQGATGDAAGAPADASAHAGTGSAPAATTLAGESLSGDAFTAKAANAALAAGSADVAAVSAAGGAGGDGAEQSARSETADADAGESTAQGSIGTGAGTAQAAGADENTAADGSTATVDAQAAAPTPEQLAAADEPFNYHDAYALKLPELEALAKQSGIRWEGAPQRRKLLESLLARAAEQKRPILVKGLVELLEDGFGFVVFGEDNYRLRSDSPFLAAALIQRYGLQRGHEIEALLHPAREGETTPFVLRVDTVMGKTPEEIQRLTPFKELTPYYPTERILLESEQGALGKWDNISMRIVDLLSPVGLGQRGLIVAPPRTGKTVLMQGIANAIRVNRPEARLIILLVDERPEEVTDFRRSVKGAQVVSSTFDEAAESHVHAAEMVIEKARRLVEVGEDVIILLDSITRLARAYNTTMPSSGKILSGGVEAGALQKPKRFFGSARNIEDGGSLTILGTALVETGSKMDEVIFEEFKGTGNMELHLDRDLSNKRVFPALSFEKSGTRKEELLYHPDEMEKVHALRRAMKGVPSTEAMEMLIQRVKRSKTNAQFLMSMAR